MEQSNLPPGTILKERWRIEGLLEEEAFETIYLGRDLKSEQAVTIKVYRPDTAYRAGSEYNKRTERYLQEARTVIESVGRVPGMAAVLSCFLENDIACIILEHVEGLTLLDYVKERGGGIPAGELLELLRPVFGALSALHAAGMVHGKVNPDAVRLVGDSACLVDFGCTPETYQYLTPWPLVLIHGFTPVEQYQCKGHHGPWTDVYALSATIYYCLTGRVPPNALDRMLRDDSPLQRPTALGADLPEWQEDALMWGLEVRPRARPQTMDEFARKLFPQPPPPPLSFRQRLRDLFGGGKKSEK